MADGLAPRLEYGSLASVLNNPVDDLKSGMAGVEIPAPIEFVDRSHDRQLFLSFNAMRGCSRPEDIEKAD